MKLGIAAVFVSLFVLPLVAHADAGMVTYTGTVTVTAAGDVDVGASWYRRSNQEVILTVEGPSGEHCQVTGNTADGSILCEFPTGSAGDWHLTLQSKVPLKEPVFGQLTYPPYP